MAWQWSGETKQKAHDFIVGNWDGQQFYLSGNPHWSSIELWELDTDGRFVVFYELRPKHMSENQETFRIGDAGDLEWVHVGVASDS